MFRLRSVLAVALVATASFAAVPLLQEMEMPSPTEEHAHLQKGIGEWTGTITMIMPGMPEVPSPAKETVRSAGPFWTMSTFTTEFMGQPFQGHGSHGFDPKTGKYVSTWLDNMSAHLSIMEGTYDAATHTMTNTWEAPDMTGAMAPHRGVQVFDGEDAYTMTFFTNGTKNMVIAMERASSRPAEATSER